MLTQKPGIPANQVARTAHSSYSGPPIPPRRPPLPLRPPPHTPPRAEKLSLGLGRRRSRASRSTCRSGKFVQDSVSGPDQLAFILWGGRSTAQGTNAVIGWWGGGVAHPGLPRVVRPDARHFDRIHAAVCIGGGQLNHETYIPKHGTSRLAPRLSMRRTSLSLHFSLFFCP